MGPRLGPQKWEDEMNKRTNVVRIFLTNGIAVDIEVSDDYDCGLVGYRASQGEPVKGRDWYIKGDMVTGIIRLFAAGEKETVN
jgi:hypothetical protein